MLHLVLSYITNTLTVVCSGERWLSELQLEILGNNSLIEFCCTTEGGKVVDYRTGMSQAKGSLYLWSLEDRYQLTF